MTTLRVLPLGSSDVDQGALLLPGVAAPGTRVVTPVYAFLLELSDALVLVDTGMNPVHIGQPGTGFDPWLAANLTPQMSEADSLAARLAASGLRPADITAVINTHLHFDHGRSDLRPARARRAGARERGLSQSPLEPAGSALRTARRRE